MRTKRPATSQDLRLAVECLPRRTRIAMLEGMDANQIIVGAYTSGDGICPMLAAHRAGGRTNLIAFAKAWDRFGFRDARSSRARRATERELRVLRVYLEASLLAEEAPDTDLAAAHREHVALKKSRARDRAAAPVHADPPARRPGDPDRRPGDRRPGDPDRSSELAGRSGWAWTRLVRRYDEYERILARLESGQAQVGADAHEKAHVGADARQNAGEAALSR
jgi:hypothetical protein